MTAYNEKKGFSILELMIVVTIIGILASVAVDEWNEYESSARDGIRKTVLTQLSKALELYYVRNKSYPITDGETMVGYGAGNGAKGFTGANGYISGLAPEYISELPKDPLYEVSNCADCGYMYRSDGQSYKLVSYSSEDSVGGAESDIPLTDEFYDPVRPSPEKSLSVCSGTEACTTW